MEKVNVVHNHLQAMKMFQESFDYDSNQSLMQRHICIYFS